jgi:hypothetical protein
MGMFACQLQIPVADVHMPKTPLKPKAGLSGPQANSVDVALMRIKECLRKFPMAALDPRFNDIQPGEAYPIPLF